MAGRFQALYDETAPAIVPPPEPNALAPPPSWADAATQNTEAVRGWIEEQRQISADRGLWDERGITPAGVKDAATQAAMNTVMGSTEARVARSPASRVPATVEAPVRAPVPEPAPAAVPGVEDRVSTRVMDAVNSPDAHASPDYIVDRDSAKLGNAYDKNAAHMQGEDYPDLKVKNLTGPDRIFDTATDHIQSNLLHIYNGMLEKFGPEMVDRAKLWYDGANAIAHKWAAENGYTPRQVAGMLANLSPQKDWFQNVDLGRRLLKITGEQGETRFTPDMNRWMEGYLDAKAKGATEKQMTNLTQLSERVKALQGIPFDALGPADRAIFARAFDEAYHGKSFQIVAPEGHIGGTVLNENGTPRAMGWGPIGTISKALESLGAQDLPTISRTLGNNHKVRNFYNNIMSPNSPFGDVTIDTHAIAAAHLRPLGGGHPVVERGLGMSGSANNFTGVKGLYPVYADAYRGLAKDLGMLPRELQSITWEGGRGLFSDVQKRDASFLEQNKAYWQQFQRGELTAHDARAWIRWHSKGIDAPAWWTGRGSQ